MFPLTRLNSHKKPPMVPETAGLTFTAVLPGTYTPTKSRKKHSFSCENG